LVVCNFNDKANVQGTGFTIVALHPKPGSKPLLVSSSKTLVGCDALALSTGDDIWAAAFTANDNPVLSPTGVLEINIKGKPFDRPFGQIFAQPKGGSPAFYATDAGDGTVVRINLGSPFTYDVIAKGFAINHGKPGSILGPSGLAYDPNGDQLYVVDGTNNTVVAFSKVSSIPNGGVTVEKGGKTFKGPSAKDARLVFAGAPLNGPISSALLFNGNLVVGNTGNPSGQNIMVELSPAGKMLATRNVDKGASGALFGMVATGTSAANTKLYFNDDNDNNLQVLEK
jgi:NHL repeat